MKEENVPSKDEQRQALANSNGEIIIVCFLLFFRDRRQTEKERKCSSVRALEGGDI